MHRRLVLFMGEVKFRISTQGLSCDILSCAWLVHDAPRFLVYTKALLMLCPTWRCT